MTLFNITRKKNTFKSTLLFTLTQPHLQFHSILLSHIHSLTPSSFTLTPFLSLSLSLSLSLHSLIFHHILSLILSLSHTNRCSYLATLTTGNLSLYVTHTHTHTHTHSLLFYLSRVQSLDRRL
jgi:hypothetical protein